MKTLKSFVFILLLSVLLLISGCKKEPPTNVVEPAADTVDASKANDESYYPFGKELLKVEGGVTLAFTEPENDWEILSVLPNSEKTGYAAVVEVVDKKIADKNKDSWIELQFFTTDGSLTRKVTTPVRPPYGWSESDVQYVGSSFRLTGGYKIDGGETVLFCDVSSGEMTFVPGVIRCAESGMDLIENVDKINVFSLVKDGKVIGAITVPVDHFTVDMEENHYSFDSEKLIAILESKHIRYTLNFQTESYISEGFYTDEDLHELVGVSDDGKVEVYYACGGDAGDGWWEQLVAKDKASGKFTFFTYVFNGGFGVIGANDILVVNNFDRLELFNIKTGEKVENFLDFPMNQRLLVGLIFDKKSERYILAYEDTEEIAKLKEKAKAELIAQGKTDDFSYEFQEVPIHVAILGKDGKVIKKMDTDLKIGQLNDGCSLRTVDIITNSNGSITIKTWHEEETAAITP